MIQKELEIWLGGAAVRSSDGLVDYVSGSAERRSDGSVD